MSRRQLGTSSQRVAKRIQTARQDKTRRAWLVTPYKDRTNVVLVQFNDPETGTYGTAVRARVSPGLTSLPTLDVGTSVTVTIRRGQVEVVAL
jgi:hypothetical protein